MPRFSVNIVRKSSVSHYVAVQFDVIHGVIEEHSNCGLSQQRTRK